MKTLILAAGYATRLYPLTENKSKALLPIHNKLMIDFIVESLLRIKEIDEILVVTNDRFYNDFLQWAEDYSSKNNISKSIKIVNDNTNSDNNKLGAIGDINYVIDSENINDDLLILAGDNFFEFDLNNFTDYFYEKNKDCVCVQNCKDLNLAKRCAVALLNEDNLILDLEEKPENPKSDTIAYAIYLYKKSTLPLIKEYLKEGNTPDAPGNFTSWLYKKQEVYGYYFGGQCYDIGTVESYKEVCEYFKEKSS